MNAEEATKMIQQRVVVPQPTKKENEIIKNTQSRRGHVNVRTKGEVRGWLSRLSIRLDFGSGHELKVMTLSPTAGSVMTAQPLLSLQNLSELLSLSLSLPLSLCPSLTHTCAHTLSLKIILLLSLSKKKTQSKEGRKRGHKKQRTDRQREKE